MRYDDVRDAHLAVTFDRWGHIPDSGPLSSQQDSVAVFPFDWRDCVWNHDVRGGVVPSSRRMERRMAADRRVGSGDLGGRVGLNRDHDFSVTTLSR